MRRPVERIINVRHLINRRNTLVRGIISAERSNDPVRADVIRKEVNKVNNMLKLAYKK